MRGRTGYKVAPKGTLQGKKGMAEADTGAQAKMLHEDLKDSGDRGKKNLGKRAMGGRCNATDSPMADSSSKSPMSSAAKS